MMIEPFFQEVMKLEAEGNIDSALDLLYDEIDKMMWAQETDKINTLLKSVELETLNIHLILGLLVSSLPVRHQLEYRPQFLIQAEQIIKSRGEWEDGLLLGL